MHDMATLARRLEKMEQEQERLREALSAAEQARDQFHKLYLEMMERCCRLERGLLGQKAQKLPPDSSQLSFQVLQQMLGDKAVRDAEQLEVQPVKAHERSKPTGRKPLPEDLPRVDIEIVPEQVQREGLDRFKRIGEEVTEVLERRPASVVVARIIKPKFVRRDNGDSENTEVLVGATPELPIPRGLAGPGMLADTLVKRWQDHLPLHRLEGIYARDGLGLARSTMCGWHEQLLPLVVPLIDAMRADAWEQPYLCTDATGVLVQAKQKCRTGHFFVVVAPGLHVLFEYTRKHDSNAVDTVLAGYEGFLVADAHVVYDHVYGAGNVIEVNCWAHCRSYFFKALDSDPDRAKRALGLIGALFRVERSLKDAPRKKKERIRHKHSKPIVEAFFSWCDAEWPSLIKDTPIYNGVRYARNQREGLSRFLDDGRLPIHNNISELNPRREAVGRKNWIFVGSDDGARANAAFTSLLASCRMLAVEPWSYLRDILCLLPRWPAHRLLELAPAYWTETVAREDVKALLDANPYRALTLRRE